MEKRVKPLIFEQKMLHYKVKMIETDRFRAFSQFPGVRLRIAVGIREAFPNSENGPVPPVYRTGTQASAWNNGRKV